MTVVTGTILKVTDNEVTYIVVNKSLKAKIDVLDNNLETGDSVLITYSDEQGEVDPMVTSIVLDFDEGEIISVSQEYIRYTLEGDVPGMQAIEEKMRLSFDDPIIGDKIKIYYESDTYVKRIDRVT